MNLRSVGHSARHYCDVCSSRVAKTIEIGGLSYRLLCGKCPLPNTDHQTGATGESVTPSSAMKETQMKRDDLFPSKYFRAADLGGKPLDVAIKSTTVETLKNMQGNNEDKPVLNFVGQKKSLVLNRTNFDSVAELHGDETDEWVGKRIQLYPATTRVGGKLENCVRVRATSAEAFNDSIPV
jgi:hypothetical protein